MGGCQYMNAFFLSHLLERLARWPYTGDAMVHGLISSHQSKTFIFYTINTTYRFEVLTMEHREPQKDTVTAEKFAKHLCHELI